MNIAMSGLDYSLAPIELREQLSFPRRRAGELAAELRANTPGVLGCVLISTCNRTEIYVSCEEAARPDPAAALCAAAGVEAARFSRAFVTRRGTEAVRHLAEVAAGLQSQIWGEDQIISQVKSALDTARDCGGTDPVLETLFRTAVSAAKVVKTRVRLTALPASAARRGVEMLTEAAGSLMGKKAVVIGNGEMGRLAASLLHGAGCSVTVTLRTYRHGETVIPGGCGVVPYEERFSAVDGADILLSATTSPHYTVTAEQLARLSHPPRLLMDLAIPRDIQPEAGEAPGTVLFNVDDLGAPPREIPAEARALLDERLARFYQWADYKEKLPGLPRRAPRFPLFVDLRGQRAVVVGGGAVACRRVQTLSAFGAEVTVIAPRWKGRVKPPHWLPRPYAPGDLEGAFLAVAATDDRAVNRQVGEDARGLGVPVSVADRQEECTFYFPAICLGDGLVAGVVSDGVGHKRTAEAAKAVRRVLEDMP